MEWVLRSPQIHSTFSNLGFMHGDGYHINENCNVALETILHNILTEDKYLRTYRRSISFGQNIKKDLIPLMIHAKEDKTIELLIRILVNVTIPIECLLSVEDISKTDFGRHTIFEINNLLASTKVAFTDQRATKVIIDFLKKNIDMDQQTKLSQEQSTNISNCLLLLRNILHIPEDAGMSALSPSHSGSGHNIQNQILWNIFSQSLDKVIIKLMTIPEASNWGVTMVQVVALLYKDQHVVTLHKYLNLWLEASLSESSEDNESNTSPPVRGSEDSSPMLTSDPTSDSSDTEGSGKSNDDPNSDKNEWGPASSNDPSIRMECSGSPIDVKQSINDEEKYCNKIVNDEMKLESIKPRLKNIEIVKGDEKKTKLSESSDCGYGTQIENQESFSTSSSEFHTKEKMHQKTHNPLHRINNKVGVVTTTLQERKRKKVIKRGKANIINVQGLSHKTPTDDDISIILKEFTVDFLLKGYNSLVQTLHNELLTNVQLEIDTSHFFWLVTYFLKFATQIELDHEYVCSVLSFEIVSYLTSEGVNLCEQFELAIKLDGNDLKPSIRRLHLVVTAIREFIQAAEVYKTLTHINQKDQEVLNRLQIKMCETEELGSLLVLLLRHYNPKYHSKQYLQDIIVTNHILLMFMDNAMRLQEYSGSNSFLDHIKQFATPEIMYQYGLLLEDYTSNGEFVNDCIFTIMHHVGGELGSVISLFQPSILKIFTSIWKSEFEVCDDWSDLIEYVINTFVKKPHSLHSKANFRLDTENFDDDILFVKPRVPVNPDDLDVKMRSVKSVAKDTPKERWTEDEISSLNWKFLQCNTSQDYVSEIIKLFSEDGIIKSRDSVLTELLKQTLINKDEYERLLNGADAASKSSHVSKELKDDEISKLCEQLIQDGKLPFLKWVQKMLLDTCFIKIFLEKTKNKNSRYNSQLSSKENNIMSFEIFKDTSDVPTMSPVSYHALLLNQSVPLVPWNCEQASICKDLKFLQLLNKLGFHMPVDTGRVFIRIPYFWTADILYEVAGKVAPIDTGKLKFSINDISERGVAKSTQQKNFTLSTGLTQNIPVLLAPESVRRVLKPNRTPMVNFVPMPCTSFSTVSGDTQNWLDVVQKSQEYKMTVNLESLCETASVASDLTRMYVSDEDEKSDELMLQPLDIKSPRNQPLDLQ